jgi:phage terminase large subunit
MKVTLNNKYKKLFTSDARYFICTGGRGSSKSFSISYWVALMMLFESGHTILFSRYTMSSAHISIIPEFVSKIEMMNQLDNFDITKTSITCKSTGSKIIFKGLKSSSGDQTANLKSLAGVTTWILDEAEELKDEATFDKIEMSVRDMSKQNRIILIMNPATKQHWVYERFFQSEGVQPGFNGVKNNTCYIHTTYLDNKKNLSSSWIENIEKIKYTNPEKFEHLILGGWLDVAEGVIFKNWEIGEFDKQLEYGFGMDFGFDPDPDTLTKVAIDKKNKIIYLHECIYSNRLTTNELITKVKSFVNREEIVADNSANRLIEELKRSGLNIRPCIKGAGSVEEGIKLMCDYKLIVTPTSVNLIKELNNYVWSDKKAGQPKDMYNHSCFIGDTLITTDKGPIKIKDIEKGDRVLTSIGYKNVLKRWNNGRKIIKKYRIEFDTFYIYISSTPEHKIKTNVGWIEISKLQSGMMVTLDNHLMENYISYTQDIDTFQNTKQECTQSYGNFIMENNQKDITCTTSMKIPLIIELKTLNLLKQKNIYQNTQNKDLLITQNGQKSFTRKELKVQKSGINQKKDYNGTENTLKNITGEHKITEYQSVSFVKKNIQKEKNHKDSVITIAKQQIEEKEELIMKQGFVNVEMNSQLINIQEKKIVAVSVLGSSEEEVYDLMIEDKHEYFANGVLVHNCDGFRYYISHRLKMPLGGGKIYNFNI